MEVSICGGEPLIQVVAARGYNFLVAGIVQGVGLSAALYSQPLPLASRATVTLRQLPT